VDAPAHRRIFFDPVYQAVLSKSSLIPRLTIAIKKGMMSIPGWSGGRWKVARATIQRKVRTPKSTMPGNTRDGGWPETTGLLPVTCQIGSQKQTAKAAVPLGEQVASEGEKVV
jgi:hypothetical protein